MSDPVVHITQCVVDGGTLVYRWEAVGPADAALQMFVIVYDAAGLERWRYDEDWGADPDGRIRDTNLDLPMDHFADNTEHGAWLTVLLDDVNGSSLASDRQGTSFLTGGGAAYPSADKPIDLEIDFSVPPTALRLEGTWVTFDMTNPATHDVAVTHVVTVVNASGEQVESSSEELLRAGATQTGHHMLPAGMADGHYEIFAAVTKRGAFTPSYASIKTEVSGGSITVVPT